MLDIQAERHDHGPTFHDLYDPVVELKRRHDLHPCAVRPRDGLALRGDAEREMVQELVARFRKLPEDARRLMPALLNSLAQLEVVVGDLDAAQRDFAEVARLVEAPVSRAEAHHNVYRTALERRDGDAALAALRRAVALDPETFEPFPFARYEPQRLLGAGGFGISFLCHDRDASRRVVVRALRADGLDRDIATLFAEMRNIQDLDHPALARVLDLGHGGADGARPFVVLEHFDGVPLSDFVARHGPLPPEEWFDVAWPVARALNALHMRGVLHRSLRPSCVLVRRGKNRDGIMRIWIKILDAGLSLKRALIHASASNPDTALNSALGRSVARTAPFAPPEVVGRPKGQVWVGPHSDIYSFGKLCAFGLTGRPDPDRADRLLLPEAWQELLDDCTAWIINARPNNLALVIDRMNKAPGAEERIGPLERDLNEASLHELTLAVEANPRSADAHANRGVSHARQGDFALAVADFTEALRLRPDDAALLRQRADAHARNGNAAAAIADYTEALRLEPRHVEALVNRGLTFAGRGEHDRAVADYTEALRHAPHDAGIYYNRGNAHYMKGDADLAVADYTEAIRYDARHLWALANRGKTYLLNGEPARAVADFTRVLQLEPGNQKALCDRAAAQLEMGRLDRAIADYTDALRHGASAGLYLDRGQAHVTAGDLAAAEADFTAALGLSPDNPAVLLARARARAGLGQFDEALADLDEAQRLAPQSSAARGQRGDVLVRLRRYDEAVAAYSEAIELEDEPAAAYFARGNAYAEMNDHARAVADYGEALRLRPRASAAYTNRGVSYLGLGQPGPAVEDFTRALEIEPNDLLARLQRAAALARLGRADEAIDDYSEALRLDPASARAHLGRGQLRAARGEREGALADFAQAARLEPGSAAPHLHRGHLLAELGKPVQAVAAFGEAARLAPDDPAAWYNRAVVRLAMGGLEKEALADLDEALRLAPGHAAARVNRGVARWRLGDVDGAISDFAEVPEESLARYNRAALLAERGDGAGARAELDALLAADADDVAAYLARSAVLLSLNEHEAAIADLEAGLRLAPDDGRVANNLAWLLATGPEALRQPARAVELARRACAAGEEAGRLDTLAAALAAAGEMAAAAEAQRRAVELAAEADREQLRSRLSLYE